ncbi:MAG TPA: NYN domain-containing protein, partial [Accumulibacter sp.]|nr:NYN domain-containing protein [Accumulibacter sp.]
MAVAPETAIMALYCDFENVALGVRDAKYDRFDIKPVLERLLLKGSIVVKKAYCDWERYKGFKSTMHEASFELIEIPHVRQSGKNSADIRLVVDALDLCYTKSHVDTFVIISGDSDFSPLVSKLRENAKYVIGVGVKQSTSDLLIANCDEFIFYDDLVREVQRSARRDSKEAQPVVRRTPEEDAQRREELEARRSKAIELAVATFDALVAERGDSGKIWASMLKEAIKRRKPDFAESYYGFRAFGNLLDEAQARGLLETGRDEKSGTFVMRCSGTVARPEPVTRAPEVEQPPETDPPMPVAIVPDEPVNATRGKGRGRRKAVEKGLKLLGEEKVGGAEATSTQPMVIVLDAPTTEGDVAADLVMKAVIDAARADEELQFALAT